MVRHCAYLGDLFCDCVLMYIWIKLHVGEIASMQRKLVRYIVVIFKITTECHSRRLWGLLGRDC